MHAEQITAEPAAQPSAATVIQMPQSRDTRRPGRDWIVILWTRFIALQLAPRRIAQRKRTPSEWPLATLDLAADGEERLSQTERAQRPGVRHTASPLDAAITVDDMKHGDAGGTIGRDVRMIGWSLTPGVALAATAYLLFNQLFVSAWPVLLIAGFGMSIIIVSMRGRRH